MELHRKARIGALSAALLVAMPCFGAEKVQITGSTAIELPKPTHILEESKRNRVFDGPSGRSTLEGGTLPMSPVMNNNPGADKKLKEAIDRKRNWIFVNPYEMQFDNKTEEFLKGEKGTGLYNHRLMSPEEKTVVDRFIEEGKPDRESREVDADQREHGSRNERVDQKPEFLSTAKLEGDGEKEKPKLERGFSLPPALEEKTDIFTERSAFQRKLERNPFSETAGGSRSLERSGGMTPEEREARDAELSKIYQPRVTGAPVDPGIDPVNRAFDATRQEATPFSARRADPLLNIGRAEPAVGGRNSPIFTGPANSGIGAALPSRSAGFADLAPRAPVAAPPNTSLTPPSASAPSFRAAPFVLPKPQRKF
jgi:hypothetical protein